MPLKKCHIGYIATFIQPCPEIQVRSKTPAKPEYFPALTGLRFFLAVWVILHHLVSKGMMLDQWTQSLPATLRVFLEQGHVAVRTFFALSGFVLAHGYARSRWNRRDLTAYTVARFARIYPVYLISLGVISWFVIQFLIMPEFSTGTKIQTVATYGLVLQGWMQNPGAGWNTPAWSLSCEFFFYLCLPGILLWLGPRSRIRLAVLCAVALILPVFLRRAGIPLSWKPLLHAGDFLVGIAAARLFVMLHESGSRWSRRGHWFYLPAIMIGILVVVFPAALSGLADLGTALRPLNGLLVLGLALGGGGLARLLSSAVVQYLGQASYSMYILHVPLLWWFGNHGPPFLRKTGSGVSLIYIALIIVVSAAAFELVEKPANRWIRARLRS